MEPKKEDSSSEGFQSLDKLRKAYEEAAAGRSRETQWRTPVYGYTEEDYAHSFEDLRTYQEELDKILKKESWKVDEVAETSEKIGKRLDKMEELIKLSKQPPKTSKPSLTLEERYVNLGGGSTSLDPKRVWSDLKGSLGIEHISWPSSGNNLGKFVDSKEKPYIPDYPWKIPDRYKPKEWDPKGMLNKGVYLDIDCKRNITEAIDDWAFHNRIYIVGSEGWTVQKAYDFLRHTLRGQAGKFWDGLMRHSEIKNLILEEVKLPDEVIPLFVDLLKREFAGGSLADSHGYLAEQARTALTKLQLCDMCYFEEFVCEFKDRFYELTLSDQEYAKTMFFDKLPGAWGEVAKKALQQRLLSDTSASDTLGTRIEAVRYVVRLYCMEKQLSRDLKRFPEMDKSCCSKYELVAGRYGCSPSNHSKKEKFKSKETMCKNCTPDNHKKKKWSSFNKKRVDKKNVSKTFPRRMIRKRRDNSEGRESFKEKYGRYPKCPLGKPLTECKCCWLCGKKDHKADSCPERNNRKSHLRSILSEGNQIVFEPIWSDEIDSDDESIYEIESEYEEDSDLEYEELSVIDNKFLSLGLFMMQAKENDEDDVIELSKAGGCHPVASSSTNLPASPKDKDWSEWRMPHVDLGEVYKKGWMPFEVKAKIIEKEITAEIQETESGNLCIRLGDVEFYKKSIQEGKRYVHFGLVQVGITPLVRKDLDLPLMAAVVDNSVIGNFEASLLGGARANMCQGPIWFKVWPGLVVDLQDRYVMETLCLKIKTQQWQKLFPAQRRHLIIHTRVVLRTFNTSRPALRGEHPFTEMFESKGSLREFSPSQVNPKTLSWPKSWVIPKLPEMTKQITTSKIKQDGEVIVFDDEQPSRSQLMIEMPRISIDSRTSMSEVGSVTSESRRIVGYRKIDIPIYEDEETTSRIDVIFDPIARLSTVSKVNLASYVSVQIQGRTSSALIDTGATFSCASHDQIPFDWWQKMPPRLLELADGQTLVVNTHALKVPIQLNGKGFTINELYCLPHLPLGFVLGNAFLKGQKENRPFVQDLDYVEIGSHRIPLEPDTSFRTTQRGEMWWNYLENRENRENINVLNSNDPIKKIKEKLKENFSINPVKLWNIKKPEARIELKDEATVIRSKAINYTLEMIEEFGKQIPELLELGLIRQSTSPHRSAAFMVINHAEKVRGKARMVIDYRDLNKATIDDGYDLPNQEVLRNWIRNHNPKVYSKFDLKSGYWQIKLEEKSIQYTAFTAPGGLYEWTVMPFGLKNAPGIFQRRMDRVFGDYKDFCIVYIDDVLVFSRNLEEHYEHLEKIAEVFVAEGMILSEKKVEWAKSKINFLGLEIEGNKEVLQPHIAEKLRSFPDDLEDLKQVQKFLGVLNYARPFLKELAQVARPLQKKVSSKVQWEWTEKDRKTVRKLKEMMNNLPVLELPRKEDYLILETDASELAWGAILKARTDNSEERCCRYWSGSFHNAEINYPVHEKEVLAVIQGIKANELYLAGQPEFLIRTDSSYVKSFPSIRLKQIGQSRLVRWQQWLQYFRYKIELIKSEKNLIADFLSREIVNQAVLQEKETNGFWWKQLLDLREARASEERLSIL